MKTRQWPRLTVALAAIALATSCGSPSSSADGGVGGGQGGGAAGGGSGGGSGGGGGGAVVSEECLKPANVAKAQSLTGAQPTIGVRSKKALTQHVTFASLADDATVSCSVDLTFKDQNDNGTLEPYEDWRQSADARASDLLGRMSPEEKMALLLHPASSDVPTTANPSPSAPLAALLDGGVRFVRTAANGATVIPRATWANTLQAQCEASPLGIPLVLSSEPAHSSGNGRVKARGFSQWPHELGLAASGDAAAVEQFGAIVSQEYRAIGIRLALSPSADLATDPRWYGSQFTFGEDSAQVAQLVAAYVKGLQGPALGATSVAAVVGHYPGAGAAKGGGDARLAKGKLVTFSGTTLDQHLAPFDRALDAGVAGVMPGYGVLETGTFTAKGGLIDGSTLEQVAPSFNHALLTDVLRTHSGFGGLVVAPWGVLEDEGSTPPAAPWGVESLTRVQRLAKAVNAGVDQFGGLGELGLVAQAKADGLITQAQVDAAAGRALALAFKLGLFENPYVDAAKAPTLCNTDTSYRAGLTAMNRGMVLVHNAAKPANWLNGAGDGTQTGDKGNAGNGTLKVLPAPPGEPYVSAGCSFYVMGNFDLDYVNSVSAGYGELTNNATSIKGVTVSTAAQRIALSDYVLIRLDAPFTADVDSGPLALPTGSLEYAGSTNGSQLDPVATARAAIAGWAGSPASRTQIVVGLDSGRPSVVSELLAYDVAGLYLQWAGSLPSNQYADKVFLDVAFGIVDGASTLPVGLPLSNAAAATQKPDVAGDGQHPTYVKGYGLTTPRFQ